jgi:hypothetical protein
MKVVDLSVGAESEIPDPRTSPLLAEFESKRRRLLDELATVEARITGGPALRERLQALEADALIGKPVGPDLEKARVAVRDLSEAEQRASILHRALRTLEKECLEAGRAVLSELAPIAIDGVYAEAVRNLTRNLLAARASALRVYGLRRQLEERFSAANPTGVHLPGYAATPILALATTWHRLLAAQFCELKGWLRDAYDLGLLRVEDLGGVYEPKPAPARRTGTIVSRPVSFVRSVLVKTRSGGADFAKEQAHRDRLVLKPDDGGDVLEFDGFTELEAGVFCGPLLNASSPKLRAGQRVEFQLGNTADGKTRVQSVRLI